MKWKPDLKVETVPATRVEKRLLFEPEDRAPPSSPPRLHLTTPQLLLLPLPLPLPPHPRQPPQHFLYRPWSQPSIVALAPTSPEHSPSRCSRCRTPERRRRRTPSPQPLRRPASDGGCTGGQTTLATRKGATRVVQLTVILPYIGVADGPTGCYYWSAVV
jgi:hypothetical protein